MTRSGVVESGILPVVPLTRGNDSRLPGVEGETVGVQYCAKACPNKKGEIKRENQALGVKIVII